MTISEIQKALREKKISAREITEGYLKTIEEKNGDLNAVLEVFTEDALKQADAVDEKIRSNAPLAPLAGVPLITKDNMLIKGKRASAASKMLEDYVAPYDAGVIKKLNAEDAIYLGRANMDEFAMGSSGETSAYGATKNPHDTTRVAGGSSSGSVAAVASNMAPASLGSDTGGSIRFPAHLCGVVGLKPTYGAVSRSGLIAMASSLDQIGPVTQTVEDAKILFHAIAGRDPYDNTSVAHDYTTLETPWEQEKATQMTVGLPKEYFENLSPMVEKALQEVIETYKKAGVRFKEISLPHTKYGIACYYIIQPAEVSSNMARYDNIRYKGPRGITETEHDLESLYVHSRSLGFGDEVKRRIMLGTFALSSGYYDAYYKKAQEARAYVTDDFTEAFKDVDLILSPVGVSTAFQIGEKTNDPLAMYMNDALTIPVNLAGLPAISVPTKQKEGALPIGFQLIANKWKEADLFTLGALYEKLA